MKENSNNTSKRNVYDIDVFEILDKLKREYPDSGDVNIYKGMTNSAFFELQEDLFVKNAGIDLSKEQKLRCYILPSTSGFYSTYLGWKILIINPYKIEALLTHQLTRAIKNYHHLAEDFCGLVEHHVFRIVETKNYRNEGIRLEKIMDWVTKNRMPVSNFPRFGFESNLTDSQIKYSFDQLILRQYISNKTDFHCYKAIFKKELLPFDFEPVQWILHNNNELPHKTALREFLTLALGRSPDQKTVNICFTDGTGEIIQLAKPKKGEFSNHYSVFEEILKG